MSLRKVPNSTSVDEIVGIIKEDGGVIIRQYLKLETLEGLRNDLMPILEETPGAINDEFSGAQTRRIARLLVRTPHMIDVAMNPLYLETARQILQTPISMWAGEHRYTVAPDIQIGLTQAIQIRPGQGAQPLHRDDSVWLWRHPTYQREARVQLMVAVSEFTKANGATKVIPSSHKWDDERMPTEVEAVSAEMDAGDALIFIGSMYHGGGNNTGTTNRTGLTMSYDLAILRQEENQYLSIPISKLRELPEELQKLLGWAKSSTFMGFVESDGQLVSPLEVLAKGGLTEVGMLD